MRNIRRFRKGIFDNITVPFELTPEGDGSHMHAELGMESSNLLGTLFLLLGGGKNLALKVETFIAANAAYMLDNGPLPAGRAGDKSLCRRARPLDATRRRDRRRPLRT